MNRIVVLLLCIIGLMLGCMRPPSGPEGVPSLVLNLDFSKAGPALHKVNEIVELPVFDLRASTVNPDSFFDASEFHHQLYAYNIGNDISDGIIAATFENSAYIDVYDYHEYHFTGTNGITLDVTFNMFEPSIDQTHQVLLDRMDYSGYGYRLGLQNRVPYFQVIMGDTSYTIQSRNSVDVGTWNTVRAVYRPVAPFLSITDRVDTTFTITEQFPVSESTVKIGNAISYATQNAPSFYGMVRSLLITANLDFEEFDLVRVAVMDANLLVKSDSLREMTSEELYSYLSYYSEQDTSALQDAFLEFHRLEMDSLYQVHGITWGDWYQVWDNHFDILSEQNLIVKDGFAEGEVTGIPGLNLVAVGAIREDRLIYTGYGFAWAYTDRSSPVYVAMGSE